MSSKRNMPQEDLFNDHESLKKPKMSKSKSLKSESSFEETKETTTLYIESDVKSAEENIGLTIANELALAGKFFKVGERADEDEDEDIFTFTNRICNIFSPYTFVVSNPGTKISPINSNPMGQYVAQIMESLAHWASSARNCELTEQASGIQTAVADELAA